LICDVQALLQHVLSTQKKPLHTKAQLIVSDPPAGEDSWVLSDYINLREVCDVCADKEKGCTVLVYTSFQDIHLVLDAFNDSPSSWSASKGKRRISSPNPLNQTKSTWASNGCVSIVRDPKRVHVKNDQARLSNAVEFALVFHLLHKDPRLKRKKNKVSSAPTPPTHEDCGDDPDQWKMACTNVWNG
jgi:hypothetical protein